MHICYIYSFFFSRQSKWSWRLSYVYPCVSLINQVLVICSFTLLHRLVQLCFTWVILDLEDSCKWIIASLNRLMHWKIRLQSLQNLWRWRWLWWWVLVKRGCKVGQTSKFECMLDNTRMEKIISVAICTTIFFEVSALLDVRHCPKLQSYAISRKTSDATWENGKNPNFGSNLGAQTFFHGFSLY